MTPEDYLNLGWYIFPCHSIQSGKCTCGKQCNAPGKHPRTQQGVKDASNDPQVIKNWWLTWPTANIGLACGVKSNIVVIDVDQRKSGFESIDEYEAARQHGPLPESLKAISGGGGRHFFFAYPHDGQPIPNRVDWIPGVDVRSDGGYVILSPGTHLSGGRYSWANWGTEIVPLPLDIAGSIRLSSNGSTRYRDEIKDTGTILTGVPEGQRDDTLFRWACRLRRQHAGDKDGGYSVVLALVMQAARAASFPEDQARSKVDQAFKQDHVDDPMDWAIKVATEVNESGESEERILENLTDVGNRNRFIVLHGDHLRYVPQMGWLRWTEQGWKQTSAEFVQHLTEDVSPLLIEEATLITDTNIRKQWKRWARDSENRGRLNAIEGLARTDPAVLRNADDFDAAATELACRNGIVDLVTGRIRPFEKEDLVTKNTGIVYDPKAKLKEWDDFLDECTRGDKELQRYLQLAAGYTATGLNTQECFFIVTGPPASGKSTYLDAISTALGAYSSSSQSDTFMYRRGKDAPKEEIARLLGIRMTTVSEIREGEYFNEALVKQITGGDKVTARFLYKDTFEFTPQFKMWIGTNHDPSSHDTAMLRRIKRIRFEHTVPPEKRDPKLKLLVRDIDLGSPAILAWIVEGAKAFLTDGVLSQPHSITAAVDAYRMEQDVLASFINDDLQVGGDKWVYVTELFNLWREWCRTQNEQPGKAFTFKQRMNEKGYLRVIASDGREYFKGVAPKPFMVKFGEQQWS